MRIKFLGTHSAESKNTRLASFVIDDVLAVDAGSLVSELTFPEQAKIRAILLSHGHYDHIRDVPAFVFNNPSPITKVFATPQTLQILSSHLLDGVIYPKFTDSSCFLGKPTMELLPVEHFQPLDIEGYRVLAVPVKHSIGAVGFEITSKEGKSIFYTGDTGPGLSSLWERVSPQLLIADVTFPDHFEDMAKDAGHLSPKMLGEELGDFRRIKGYLPQVCVIHLNAQLELEISREIEEVAHKLGGVIRVAREADVVVL